MLTAFIKSFFGVDDDISREALIAYFNRLPAGITVRWEKDGQYIIGTINAEKNEFMTQSKNPDDFVDMVNDAIYTVYNIPERYRRHMKSYLPSGDELKKLGSSKILNSTLNIRKTATA